MLKNYLQYEGGHTWNRNDQKSVIDFALCNKFFDMYTNMKIDLEQGKIDIYDPNLLEINFKVIKEGNKKFEKAKWGKIGVLQHKNSVWKYMHKKWITLQTRDLLTI